MKIIIYSDLHAHKYGEYSNVIEGINSRLWHTLDVVKQIGAYAKSNGIKNVFFGGDLYDSKSIIDTETQHLTIDAHQKAFEGCRVFAIPGNHDMAKKGRCNLLKGLESVAQVFHSPGIVKLGDKVIAMIPYMHDKQSLFHAIKSTKADIMIAHEGVVGAKLPSGMESSKGLSTGDFTSGGHKKIYLGHYHDPECLKHNKIKFIGSPLHINRSDNTTRGFLVVDLDTLEDELIPTIYPNFLVLKDFHMSQLEDADIKDLCQKHYVKFEVTPKVAKEIKQAVPEDLRSVFNILEPPTETANRIDIHANDEVEEILDKYLKQHSDPEDIERLKKMGLALIAKTREDKKS